MPGYRRNYEGSLFFFTIVTHSRHPIFEDSSARVALGRILRQTRQERPWTTEAIVLLPDHLHMIWRLPENDSDYSRRVAVVKKRFTRWYLKNGRQEQEALAGKRRQRYRGVWQPRFWEHTLRDARDFKLHVDYIHLNPVKHGYVDQPAEWPWSSFKRHVEMGHYPADWIGRVDLPGSVEYYGKNP